MNPYRIALLLLMVCVLAALPLLGSAAASPAVAPLHPRSVVNQLCCSRGALSSLRVLDQAGRQDTPANYMAFTTPGHVYRGYRTYFMPTAILRSSVSALRVKVNYKGPAAAAQAWVWYAWNWTTSTWTRIGANTTAAANTWTTLTFVVPGPRAYIRNATGEVRILLASGNASGDARLDYEAVLISYSSTPVPTPTLALGQSPDIVGCTLYPSDNVWNTPINTLPVSASSSAWINSIGASSPGFHMDFGSGTWDGGPIGIPYNVVNGSQVSKYAFQFYYPDESDPGPYPLPANPAREWGSDHHILVLDSNTCKLYEVYDASYSAGKWHAVSGAIWDLASDALRPAGWTSADAAGLPILAGLVRYQEIAQALAKTNPADQVIHHALRFTASTTHSYIWPARHLTSGGSASDPPMGARFRLKAGYNIAGFSPELQVLLRTMKTYGIILADNGSPWMVSGSPDQRWNNDTLHDLDVLTGNNFEAVDERCLMVGANSGQADPSRCP